MKQKQFLILLFLSSFITSYSQNSRSIIKDYLTNNTQELNVESDDVSDFIILDEVFSKSTKITHVYIKQVYNGIEIFNGRANFNLLDGHVFSLRNRLVSDISSKTTGIQHTIDHKQAVQKTAILLGLTAINIEEIDSKSSHHKIFSNAGISLENIPVKLVYILDNDILKLAYDLNISEQNGQNWWSIRLDANTGEIIEKNNWVKHCDFGNHEHTEHSCNGSHAKKLNVSEEQNAPLVGAYNVFALPLESPSHGPRTLVTNPDDGDASPFGWHDTNGSNGSEYNYWVTNLGRYLY